MSRRPLNRARKFIFNDAMVDAFRAALAAPQDKAFAAWQHLDVVTNRKPWQFPMLDPDRDDELQQALIAKLSPDELELCVAASRQEASQGHACLSGSYGALTLADSHAFS